MPGAQCTRSLVCEVGGSKCTRVFTAVAPEITRHPRTQWFYGLFRALPGDRAFLSPSPRGLRLCPPGRARKTSARLDAGVEASGPHDFTVRTSAVRLRPP
jgi:hypothetical protein